MTVNVLFFSTLQQLTGRRESRRQFDGRSEITVAEALEALYGDFPELRRWDAQILVAVDLNYARREDTVRDGQELAIMPPVQGG